MSKVLITESSLHGIGDALRRRYGNSNTYKPAQMEAAVDAVPNAYAAGDEGKVVSNGALVAQTAHADVTPTTSDQTIDTTGNNSIKVKGDANLVAGNIKKNVSIFGVTGSYEGSGGGGGGGSFPSLPSAYQRVEYIQSTGVQWANNTCGTILTGKFVRIILNTADTSAGENCALGFRGDGGVYFECYTSGSYQMGEGYGQTPIVYKTYTTSPYTLSGKVQLIIWKVGADLEKSWIARYRDATSGSYPYNGKIYRITVSNSSDLEWDSIGTTDFDFIPCYRKSDNVPGFYEVVTNTFLPSESGTDFVAGPDA